MKWDVLEYLPLSVEWGHVIRILLICLELGFLEQRPQETADYGIYWRNVLQEKPVSGQGNQDRKGEIAEEG